VNGAGPAAPILVIERSDDGNRFHRYIEEILLTEGYPWFERLDLARESLDLDRLQQAALVLVSSVRLEEWDEAVLLQYARDGGRLLLLRPPLGMARELGLRPFNHVLYRGTITLRGMLDRWLHLNAAHLLTAGMTDVDLQFHGRADLLEWTGPAEAVVAWLAPFSAQPSTQAAIVATPYGRGRVALFTFDLATSTVFFHQGRREQASTGPLADADADAMFKPNDLFVNYLDGRLKQIPQADLHQDLFVRLVGWLLADHPPLPRLWHFPNAAPAVAFFNGDGDNLTADDLRTVTDTADRFAAPFTTYLMLDNYPVVEPAWEAELRARGHSFGQHAWAGPAPSLTEMRSQLRHEFDAFRERYGHGAVSYRGHNVIWTGWTEMATYLHENGVRLDVNFLGGRYHRDGYVTGSGLPVKFMDEDGSVIDVYEQCTLTTDDGMLTDKTYLPAYAIEEAIAVSRRYLEDAAGRYHTVYHPYFHPHSTSPNRLHTHPWLSAMLWYARKLDVPYIQDAAWLDFNDARRVVELEDWRFDADQGRLHFTLHAPQAVDGLTVLLPWDRDGGRLQGAWIDGQAVPDCRRSLEGRDQAALCASFGADERRRFVVQWGQQGP
jgi:hypothetical protein